MTGVSTLNSKTMAGPDKSNPNRLAQLDPTKETMDSNNPNSRSVASGLAKAGSIGMDVAGKSANILADATTHIAQEKAKAILRVTVTDRIRDISQMFHMVPGGQRVLSGIINNFFYPYYKKANPATILSPDEIANQLMRGHTEFLEDDLVNSFDKFIRDNLTEEEKVKYEAGEKLVVANAFKNMMLGHVKTAKEPGGIKKIATKIADWIPLVNKLPEGAKPWAGGAIGSFIGYKVLHGMWKLVKLAIIGFTGVKGFQMVKNKFGGGAAPPPIPDLEPGLPGGEAKPKGKMAGLLDGVSKVAQMAGGAGAMGGGGPAGGLLSMLAGGGR